MIKQQRDIKPKKKQKKNNNVIEIIMGLLGFGFIMLIVGLAFVLFGGYYN